MAILDNPIFEYEEKKSVMTDEHEIVGDAEGQHQSMAKDSVKHFAQEIAKKWPFGTLKTLNTLFLLALAICACVSHDKALSWSNFPNAISNLISTRGAWVSTDTLCRIFIGFFVFSFLSMVAYWILRRKLDSNKHSLGCIGIGDMLFSIISILLLINAFALYGLMATAEWKWFYPKFTNSSTTLAELTEYNLNDRPSWDYRNWRHYDSDEYDFRPFTTTPNPNQIPEWKMHEMENRKKQIFIRLAMDSSVLILLAILIIQNLISFFRIRKLIKRTHLWLSNFGQFYTECNKKDKKYAKLWPNGLFKIIFWGIPMFAFFTNDRGRLTLEFGIFIFVMFCNWLYFVRKTRFRSADDLEASKSAGNVGKFRFAKMAIFDIFLGIGGIIFYKRYGYDVLEFAFLLHLIHIFYIAILGGAEMLKGANFIGIKLPQISINVSVNVSNGNEKVAKHPKTNNSGHAENGNNDGKLDGENMQEEKKLLPSI